MNLDNADRVVVLLPKIMMEQDKLIPQIKALRDLLECSLWEAKHWHDAYERMVAHFNSYCASDTARAQYMQGYMITRKLASLKGTPGMAGYIEGIR